MKAIQILSGIKENSRSYWAKNYSRFLIASDGAGWVLDEEGKEILKLAKSIGIPGGFIYKPARSLKQCIHYTSQFSLAQPGVFNTDHRISVDYFHGKPEQGADFEKVYEAIKKNHQKLSKVRVSYSEMQKLLLTTGIDPAKIIRIPIGINPDFFKVQTAEGKSAIRTKLNIPMDAVVIGSFQKDGNGWGEGLEPKRVKGPDIFLGALEILKEKVPNLYVLLTGPARGFVKKGLEKLNIPYQHHLLKNYTDVGQFYLALDAYIVPSREEGGPKAVLESMVSRIPIISTRVGQSIDLIKNGENGYIVDIEDTEALAEATFKVLNLGVTERQKLLDNGYKTALENSYRAQEPLWKKFFQGYVNQ